MLDIKMIRQNPEKLTEALKKRNSGIDVNSFLKLDERRREILTVSEQLKKKQNDASKLIPKYKKEGKDTSKLMEEMKNISLQVKDYDTELKEVEDKIKEIVMFIPNIPNEKVPYGLDDSDNEELRRVGEPQNLILSRKHTGISVRSSGILDAERAAKLPGQDLLFIRVWEQDLKEPFIILCWIFTLINMGIRNFSSLYGKQSQHDGYRSASQI